jgi:hypothetical protein
MAGLRSMHLKLKKGALHSALGVKRGDKIPASDLEIHKGDSPLMRRRKQFAINAAKWHK